MVSLMVLDLTPPGKLFVQVFSHKEYAYNFIPVDATDWMAKHFFLNGTMPSDDLFLYFQVCQITFRNSPSQRDLSIAQHWRVDGRNYGKTSRCWLKNLDENIPFVVKLFEETYGKEVTILLLHADLNRMLTCGL